MPISDNLRGVIYMNVSMLAFTVNDSFVKAVTDTLPLFQTIALRGAIATVALLILAQAMGGLRLWPAPQARGGVALRSLAEVAGTVFFLTALMHMPLATLSAIMQALPLAVALAAAVFLHEPLGWRRMTAIAVGFGGVMIIIRPGAASFDVWSVIGLASVCCVVVRDLVTRQFSRDIPSTTVAIWASVSVTLMGGVGAVFEGWHTVTLTQGLMIAASSSALIAGYMFSIMVMRVGDISVIAPFRYTALLWAILLGWLAFGTLPDQWTLIGAAIVVASGLFALWREQALRRARQA